MPHYRWPEVEHEQLSPLIARRLISGDRLASVLGRLLRPADGPAGTRPEVTETTS